MTYNVFGGTLTLALSIYELDLNVPALLQVPKMSIPSLGILKFRSPLILTLTQYLCGT